MCHPERSGGAAAAKSNGSLPHRARVGCRPYCQTNCIGLSRDSHQRFLRSLRSVFRLTGAAPLQCVRIAAGSSLLCHPARSDGTAEILRLHFINIPTQKRTTMAKSKSVYVCSECGAQSPQWLGRCPGCGKFGTLVEEIAEEPVPQKAAKRERSGSFARPVP